MGPLDRRARPSWPHLVSPVSERRHRLALSKQRRDQERKRSRLSGHEAAMREAARVGSERAHRLLSDLGFGAQASGRVVEIGSGATGLIWRWPGAEDRTAVDPLADFYRERFAFLQEGRVRSLVAVGESVPLPAGSADLVLSDNVLDHCRDPLAVLREMRRILAPEGVALLTADVHHPVWGHLGRVYGALVDRGVSPWVPAFTSHPFHFREAELRQLIRGAGFSVLAEGGGAADLAPLRRRLARARGPRDLVTALLYKNQRLWVVLGEAVAAASSGPGSQ